MSHLASYPWRQIVTISTLKTGVKGGWDGGGVQQDPTLWWSTPKYLWNRHVEQGIQTSFQKEEVLQEHVLFFL